MLILLNSAFREGYLRNVLKTLHLPSGALNTYRYAIRDEGKVGHIESGLIESSREGEKVLLCFVDRFNETGGYGYIPLRFGVLSKPIESAGRAFLSVRLEEYVSAENLSIPEFSRKIRSACTEVADLTGGGPESTNDGLYVFRVGEHFEADSGLSRSAKAAEVAWYETVRRLSPLRAFNHKALSIVFSRVEMEDGSEVIRPSGRDGLFPVKSGAQCRLRLWYKVHPDPGKVDHHARLRIQLGGAVIGAGVQDLPIDLPEDVLEVPIFSESFLDERRGSVALSIVPSVDLGEADSRRVLGVSHSMEVAVGSPEGSRELLVAALVLYSLAEFCVDPSIPSLGAVLKVIAVSVVAIGLGKKLV